MYTKYMLVYTLRSLSFGDFLAICILVLIITVIFRKNFYRALSTKMKTNIVETKEKVGYTKTEKKSDSKMKIYIDKEIK